MHNGRSGFSQLVERGAKLESLTHRLQDGEARIQAALARGEDVAAWEDFWVRLLHEYEALHDRIESDPASEHVGIAA